MDTRDSLTVRTVSALQRLADLETRGRSVPVEKSGVLKSALGELELALEELRTASEQLNELMDDISGARAAAQKTQTEFTEFRDAVPLPCVLTDDSGQILEANPAAGALLNVNRRHLAGKPLALYMMERDHFFRLIASIQKLAEPATAELIVRPRERKPRPMSIRASRLEEADRLCWFFSDVRSPKEESSL